LRLTTSIKRYDDDDDVQIYSKASYDTLVNTTVFFVGGYNVIFDKDAR